MDEDWGTERPEVVDPEAERDERLWRRRVELADEARRSVELDEQMDLLPFTLREASRAVDDVLQRLLNGDGHDALPLNCLHVLVLARRHLPIVAISHQLRVSPQAAGRLVKRLVADGLVHTGVSPMDSRVRLVEITPAGKALMQDLRLQLSIAVNVVNDAVGEERLVTLSKELADLALIDLGPRMSW